MKKKTYCDKFINRLSKKKPAAPPIVFNMKKQDQNRF